MKKLITALVFTLVFACNAIGQRNYYDQYNALVERDEMPEAYSILTLWAKDTTANTSPEFYVSSFNYYVMQARQEVLSLTRTPNEGDYFQLQKEGDTIPQAYLGASITYLPEYSTKAIDVIDQGIARYPNRMDLWFGKIYFLGKMMQYDAFTTEIVNVINQSAKNDNKWLWENNQPVKDGFENFSLSIQDYIGQLYETNDDSLLYNMLVIAEAMLKHYPNNVTNLSNASIYCMYKKDYNKALTYLLKAETIDPNDYIVINNIANCYFELNNKPQAIAYYKRYIALQPDNAAYAERRLRELDSK